MAVILLLWRSIFFRMSRMKEWVVLTRTKDQKQCQLKDEASSCTGQNVWQICIHLIVGSISWSLMLLTMRCTLKQKKIKMLKENILVFGLSKGNFWGPKPNLVLVVLSGPRKAFFFFGFSFESVWIFEYIWGNIETNNFVFALFFLFLTCCVASYWLCLCFTLTVLTHQLTLLGRMFLRLSVRVKCKCKASKSPDHLSWITVWKKNQMVLKPCWHLFCNQNNATNVEK